MNCFDCANSRLCQSWGEVKCVKKCQRMYKILDKDSCKDFIKRDKGHILDIPCQCEDCLRDRGEG